jgi:hypothetical protein
MHGHYRTQITKSYPATLNVKKNAFLRTFQLLEIRNIPPHGRSGNSASIFTLMCIKELTLLGSALFSCLQGKHKLKAFENKIPWDKYHDLQRS